MLAPRQALQRSVARIGVAEGVNGVAQRRNYKFNVFRTKECPDQQEEVSSEGPLGVGSTCWRKSAARARMGNAVKINVLTEEFGKLGGKGKRMRLVAQGGNGSKMKYSGRSERLQA